MYKKISIILSICMITPLHGGDLVSSATHALNARRGEQVPMFETKKDWYTAMEHAKAKGDALLTADDNKPFDDLNKTCQAGWKYTWCQKNPGRCALYWTLGIGAVVVVAGIVIYKASGN